jgi:plastocyanin
LSIRINITIFVIRWNGNRNDGLEMKLVIRSWIGIGIALLFTHSIFVLSPINSAFSIEEQHENDNKEGATIAGQIMQTISNNTPHDASKTFTATTIPSSSSSINPSNLTSRKSAVVSVITKTPSENKVLIGDEENKKPFNPSPINSTIGNTIIWINTDVETHTVTSGSPDNNITKGKEFDSGNLNPNQTFEHLFNKAGTYNYFCIIHPSMAGVINVK